MSDFDEKRSIYNGTYEVEVTINRPVAEVWLQHLDVASWVTSHRIENVFGEPGTLGSINRVSFKKSVEMDMPTPHYHYCKIIKLVPEKCYMIKTYSEKGGSYGIDMTAFDDTRFIECDGKTKVIFNIYAEIVGESIAQDPDSMSLEISRAGMIRNLNKLKLICENR